MTASSRYSRKLGQWLSKSVKIILLVIISIYQCLAATFTGGSCRFEPSCSVYAGSVIKIHGPWRGILLSLKRLYKCGPGGSFGFDPVPTKERS